MVNARNVLFQAFVRYDEENLAVKVLEKVNEAMPDGIILNGNKLECRVLEGNIFLFQILAALYES